MPNIKMGLLQLILHIAHDIYQNQLYTLYADYWTILCKPNCNNNEFIIAP